MSRRPTRSSPRSAKGKRKAHKPAHAPRRSRRPSSPAPPAPAAVVSAGALCWRRREGVLEVLVVRSARWGDWSWPKGKIEPGETLPECAVREVEEETGVRPLLGRPLPSVGYVLPDGRDKTVAYWAAQVLHTSVRTADADEIAEVAWLPVADARKRLTRPSDLPPLESLLQYSVAGELDTRALIILRHAKARSRANWPGTEGDRPLTSVGRSQANALPGLLAAWNADNVLSSPWARCMMTLLPYLRVRNPAADPYQGVEVLPLLSEQGLRNDPERVPELLRDIIFRQAGSWLICTHRPVLESVVGTLAEACSPAAREDLPAANPWLGTGEALIAHIAGAEEGTAEIVAVERLRAETG
ncbi:NUDIX hydrolase [Kineosporia babensis]|uniref:NUDIX domain-containing protein n=1 Tax=Kineosporia babensis TaxID=499548 RepID=A0A9X1NA85_9ACTN|nr:NUDIX domain-containing protein [Kineosporia babensis]